MFYGDENLEKLLIHSKELINTAIKRRGTPAGDAAGTRIMSELNEGTKSASKFNAYKEKVLSRFR